VCGSCREGARRCAEGAGYIDQANKKIERDKILDIVETEPKQFQIVLYSILQLTKEKTEQMFTGDVYNLYQDVCKKTKSEVLTQRRVSDIIAEIDMLGLINAKVISKGRHGRTKEIKLSIPPQLTEKVDAILTESLGI
jgi:cell division control protein 6